MNRHQNLKDSSLGLSIPLSPHFNLHPLTDSALTPIPPLPKTQPHMASISDAMEIL